MWKMKNGTVQMKKKWISTNLTYSNRRIKLTKKKYSQNWNPKTEPGAQLPVSATARKHELTRRRQARWRRRQRDPRNRMDTDR